jgi:hypothetical protein
VFDSKPFVAVTQSQYIIAIADDYPEMTIQFGIQLNVYSITRAMNDGAGGTFCPAPVGNGGYPAPRQTGWGWSASSNATFGVGLDNNPLRLVEALLREYSLLMELEQF